MTLALGVPGIGPLLIVLAVVIIVLGPKRIPALMKQLGGGLKEFRKSVGGDDDDETLTEGDSARRRQADRASSDVDSDDPGAPKPPQQG